MRIRAISSLAAITATFAVISTAFAHDHRPSMPPTGYAPANPAQGYPAQNGDYAQQRDRWLADCRQRQGDNGVGGALICGVAGGLLGRQIAGHGNRTVGTVAGAAVGAVAGAVIDKAEDRSRVADRCEQMLNGYSQGGYGQAGYGGGYGHQAYGYAMPMMMVPVMMISVPAQQQNCHEHETVEYVTSYHTVYRKVREVRYAPAPQYKRVRIVPDKRVRMAPGKRVPMN